MGISAEFECFHPMGLEVMFFPDALHARGADSLGFGHGTDAPMSRIFGSTVQGGLHNDGFLFDGNLPGATGAWSILQNAGQPLVLITPAPQQYGGKCCRQLASQHFVGNSFGSTQNDLDPERDGLRSASQFAELKQLLTFTLSQRQRGSRSTRHGL